MRIFLLVILFFSVFFNQEIKVISYNIRYDNPQDGKDSWEKRKSYFIDYINKENPDFIGLQEVTFNQLTFINDNLKDYKYLGVGRDDGKNKGYVLMDFLSLKIPIEKYGFLILILIT